MGISPSLEFKIHWGTLADISDDIPKALWRILYLAQKFPQPLETRNKLPFPQRVKSFLSLPE